MPAVIESTLYESPGGAVVAGSTQQNSRDDLRLGYQVVLRSVHEATTYSWSLSYASDSPGSTVPGTPFDGTESSSALLAPEGSTSRDAKFNVDYEGSYLIRLVVDAGLPTEDTQFIRTRVLSLFGALKMVAAGERRDEKGVIPVDASPEGWANDQNQNMQRVALLLRRLSTSGRVLYVDANRGRDNSADQDDYDNVISIPGPEVSRTEETGIKLRAMAHGDFSNINEAISYAAAAASRGEPAPSASNPYYIVIRKGLYEEDLNLTSWVHLIGDDIPVLDSENGEGALSVSVRVQSVNAGGTGTHRYNPQGLAADHECVLFNIGLTGQANTTLPVLDHQGGLLKLVRCLVMQEGNAITQGEAIRCVVSNAAYAPQLWLEDCLVATDATTADRVALRFDAINGFVVLDHTRVLASSAIAMRVNESLYETCQAYVQRQSRVSGLYGYYGYASNQLFKDSDIYASGGNPAIVVEPFGAGAGSKAGAVYVDLDRVRLSSPVSFSTAGAVGLTSIGLSDVLSYEATSGSHVIFPDAPGDQPDAYFSSVDAESLKYHPDHADPLLGPGAPATVPAANQLPKGNVQEAIDLLVTALFPLTGSPFYSLETAYRGLSGINPPTLGDGLGRNITAAWGAVQIEGATAPLGIDGEEKDGGLQVEGVIDIGGLINGVAGETLADVGHSEIMLNPDMIGAGPMIALGRAGWNNGITGGNRGFGAAMIYADQADPFAAPSSYNLHLRTANGRASGTGRLGNIYIRSGSIFDDASGDSPGDTHIGAGSTKVLGGVPGNIWLVPGKEASGANLGAVFFVGDGGAPAMLTAANPYVGGVAGDVFIGTPTGIQKFSFTGAEDINGATAVFNTTAWGFWASNDGTRITLLQEHGTPGDIVYVGDSTGGTTNAALGDFIAGVAAFIGGSYGDMVAVDVPSNGRLRVNGDLEVNTLHYTALNPPVGGGGGGGFGDYKGVIPADHPYTTLLTEGILGVRLGAGADIKVNLNAAYPTGTTVVIKDENFIANAVPAPLGQKITIADAGGGTVEGGVGYYITTAGGAATLYKNDAGNWFIF